MKPLLVFLLAVSFSAISQTPPSRRVEKKEEIKVEKEFEREVTVTKTKNRRVFMYIFDHSGSMAPLLEDNKEKIRVSLRTNSSNATFVGSIFPFSGCYESDENYMKLAKPVLPASGNQDAILRAAEPLKAGGSTDLARALRLAVQSLGEDDYADLMLFTDYADNCGGNIGHLVQELQKRETKHQEKRKFKYQETHIRIHVLTEAAGEDKAILRKLAQATSGKYLDTALKQAKFLEELGAKAVDLNAEFRSTQEAEVESTARGSRETEERVQARQEAKQKAQQTQRAQQKKEKVK